MPIVFKYFTVKKDKEKMLRTAPYDRQLEGDNN